MVVEDSSTMTNIESKNFSSYQKESEEKYLASKKRVKLHWGLDTKERWERKANM